MEEKRKDSQVRRISGKVSQMLGTAVELYTEGRFKEAIDIYLEIIKINPNLPEVYLTLASICEEVCIPFKFIILLYLFIVYSCYRSGRMIRRLSTTSLLHI